MQVPLGDYHGGAGVATDLVNTAPEVLVRTGDGLANPHALARFLLEHDVHPDALSGGREPTSGELAAVHALRRTLRHAFAAPDEADVARRAGMLATRAGTGPSVRRDAEGEWQWFAQTRSGAELADELALLTACGLLGVLRTLRHDRFRNCASPTCNGVFVDTSRNGRRRYCMPDICGNRINVANHRARRQGVEC